MKKFISFVMAAAMVASLVPATAFAKSNNGEVSATASIINAWSVTKADQSQGRIEGTDAPELQLKITKADYKQTTVDANEIEAKFTLTLDGAEWLGNTDAQIEQNVLNAITVEDKDHDNIVGTWDPNATAATTTYAYTKSGTGNGGNGDAIVAAWKAAAANQEYGYWDKDTQGDHFVSIYSVYEAMAEKEGNVNPAKSVAAQKAKLFELVVNASATPAKWMETTDYLGTGKEGWVCTETDSTYGTPGTFKALGTNAADATTGLPENVQSFADLVAGTYTAAEAETALGDDLDTAVTASYDYGYRVLRASTAAEGAYTPAGARVGDIEVDVIDDNTVEVTIHGKFAVDDVIAVNLVSVMDSFNTNKTATVSVESDLVNADDLVYVSVKKAGIEASIRKTVNVAEEEVVDLYDGGLVIKEAVDGSWTNVNIVELKLNKGFEFTTANGVTVESGNANIGAAVRLDGDDKLVITGLRNNVVDGKITVKGMEIEATSAKSGATATITVTAGDMSKVTVEVAKVVDYKVVMSVDEDLDVPVIYSGVNVNNDGITDSSDHETLEITLEETFPGAWSSRQGFDITLPDGVYVTDVEVVEADNFFINGQGGRNGNAFDEGNWTKAFWDAYRDGDYKNFEFGKRVFDDVDVDLAEDPASLTFILTLVADPGFEGDVEVGFEGALVDTQSVVAAKFVAPYTVKAEQNDLKIDSRYTTIPTDIVVTETADGLWDDGADAAEFRFNIEKGLISFEDDATFTVDNDSELDIDNDTFNVDGNRDAGLSFTVTDVSDKAATVTISDMELFMERNIPAGAYALELETSMSDGYLAQTLFAAEDAVMNDNGVITTAAPAMATATNAQLDNDNWVDSVQDYSNVVRDKFINVITAPRDEDGFTTKITVPVGESYIIAGEVKVEIDTPAYINANGYTMLPLRAVAVALGIDNNSVLWDQSTRTATILYGNRVVSMQNGASVMYINGQAVATKAGVEITNDRTFLSLRDLGTAMNVTDISWDAATRTAYLNAGVAEA
ncbi:copper amine oxidase N-terminal domain-containing protein [Anaerotignum lactatifermentans]|uniref:Copper amine oxidase N-terminal domain-containing protein n=1 Tax=Anaerotignum lactatifermentans TaxID=160404 RepID=A0ABS2G8H1_9FIRM|nr:copper amine oxidase N-terminal domain-containing protein [Anaerotignum lactatifermentans]MBM6829058.1 copper amine oxidase N-terminal domain-containing protein [Anaerotignum lactatifermentans]MBM6877335.1 copper amine oxidase N-terminal domain-containing protein [Anaerotignum lactatifermentans]MBM6950705.1 copper amine oxidase N-terminal domain-containing protein [Anaerotignum lactatifermentans]